MPIRNVSLIKINPGRDQSPDYATLHSKCQHDHCKHVICAPASQSQVMPVTTQYLVYVTEYMKYKNVTNNIILQLV